MTYTHALDVSVYQGTLDWPKVSEEIAIIKMSGGDAGLYIDPNANKNYYGAKAASKAVGGYHFAGGTDPVKEADYFVRAMSPLAPGDVLVLDWEVQHANPVQWCLAFVEEVHVKTGVWPLLYINASTCNAFNWEPVLLHCGLWIADYAIGPEGNVPIKYQYVMHQYSDSPYDQDAWFGTVQQFKEYGFKEPSVAIPKPAPEPTVVENTPTTVLGKLGSTLPPPPAPEPSTVIAPTATPIPVEIPVSTPIPITITATPVKPANFIIRFIHWLKEKF
jgi:lysozyme